MTDNKSQNFEMTEAYEAAWQAKVELEILLGIEQALRVALQWMMRGRGNSHKLSTLRFHTWSFERHLTRMEVLADHGGYLHLITDASPRLANQVSELKSNRTGLHNRLEKMILRLELVSHHNTDEFEKICADLDAFLNDLRKHGQAEGELLQRSLIQEVGGSG